MKASDIEVLSALQVSEKGGINMLKKTNIRKEDIKCNEVSKKLIFHLFTTGSAFSWLKMYYIYTHIQYNKSLQFLHLHLCI